MVHSRMPLRTLSFNDDRALAIRDHLLPWSAVAARWSSARRGATHHAVPGPVAAQEWTPFDDLSPEQAASPGYRHALARQRTRPQLPYGLEPWRDVGKVPSMLWAEDGSSCGGYLRPAGTRTRSNRSSRRTPSVGGGSPSLAAVSVPGTGAARVGAHVARRGAWEWYRRERAGPGRGPPWLRRPPAHRAAAAGDRPGRPGSRS